MRLARLLVVLLVVLAGGCTATTAPDEDCIMAGGGCFASKLVAPSTCGVVQAACSSGYMCCTSINAANVVDGALVDAGTAPLLDAGSADSGADGRMLDAKATDGPKDGVADGAKSG